MADELLSGTPAVRRATSVTAYAAWAATEEEHQRCEKGHCRVFRQGRCWEKYNCWYIPSVDPCTSITEAMVQ